MSRSTRVPLSPPHTHPCSPATGEGRTSPGKESGWQRLPRHLSLSPAPAGASNPGNRGDSSDGYPGQRALSTPSHGSGPLTFCIRFSAMGMRGGSAKREAGERRRSAAGAGTQPPCPWSPAASAAPRPRAGRSGARRPRAGLAGTRFLPGGAGRGRKGRAGPPRPSGSRWETGSVCV